MTTTAAPSRFGELAGDFAAGSGDARAPFVFLPGLTFDRTMWRPAVRSLRTIDPGRTTLALDMPGEGESVGTFRGIADGDRAVARRDRRGRHRDPDPRRSLRLRDRSDVLRDEVPGTGHRQRRRRA